VCEADQRCCSDQVVGDLVEMKLGDNPADAKMFGLAHAAVPLALSEDALDHRAARLRTTVTLMSSGTGVHGAASGLADFGHGIVSGHMWGDVEGARIGDDD
jgi:hypothetical protein